MNDYYKELGEALKTRNIEALKEFHIKYYGKAPDISDLALEVSMHKMICNRTDMPNDLALDSLAWLLSQGYNPWIN